MAIDPKHLPEDPQALQQMVLDLMKQLDREFTERNKIETLLRELLDLVATRTTLWASGTKSSVSGLGKTMIAQNICQAAVLAGYSVLFRSAAALLEDLQRQAPEGRRSKLRTYANAGLLCIDEVGYLSIDYKAADLLYEVVSLLDRLLHHADLPVIKGESYRVSESKQETAARRRKK